MNGKTAAKKFFKEYHIAKITFAKLERVVEEQGYRLIRFDHIENTGGTAELLHALGLEDQARRLSGFTYADPDFRLIFLREGLTEKEALKVLAHEEGHIYCGHMGRASVIGQNVEEEFEANEFAQYLLGSHFGAAARCWLMEHRALAALLAILILAGAACAVKFTYDGLRWSNCYVSETGGKYHRRDCIYIRDKENVRCLTRVELRDGGYEPCSVCLPER